MRAQQGLVFFVPRGDRWHGLGRRLAGRVSVVDHLGHASGRTAQLARDHRAGVVEAVQRQDGLGKVHAHSPITARLAAT